MKFMQTEKKTAIDLCDYSIRNHICNGTSDVV